MPKIKEFFDLNFTSEFYKPSLQNVTIVSNIDELKKYFYKFEKLNTLIYYTGRSFYKKYKESKIFNLIYSLKFKIILVSALIGVAIISIPIISVPGNKFLKHALEWDYFVGVISFYLLTFFMWKKSY